MYFAAIAQQVERILGKDEVPSSNLGSSSKRDTILHEIVSLFCALGKNRNLRNSLTHTQTHTVKSLQPEAHQRFAASQWVRLWVSLIFSFLLRRRCLPFWCFSLLCDANGEAVPIHLALAASFTKANRLLNISHHSGSSNHSAFT